ncbi:MAG: hypothetical protein ACXWXO_08150 [Nocardioides sp.]
MTGVLMLVRVLGEVSLLSSDGGAVFKLRAGLQRVGGRDVLLTRDPACSTWSPTTSTRPRS